MNLVSLKFDGFRQYHKKKFSFSPGTTIIVGRNASGKTNLMEAVFTLSTGKSFRADSDREMIAFGKEAGRIAGVVRRDNEEDDILLEILVTGGTVMGVSTPLKKFSVNGVAKRSIDFAGILKTVLFWPQDMELVTDSPSLRRRYLDFVLTQTDREYRRSLISYERGVRQRNRLLEAIRDEGAHRHQLIFWDQLLIREGTYIAGKREEYIEYINMTESEPVKLRNYKLIYDRSVISRDRLDQYAEAEIASGVTLVGPHRDDMVFEVRNPEIKDSKEGMRNLASFGSRGEQRLAILWLKLAELDYIKEKTGEKPVLLLDDILSELDHEHRKIIFDILSKQQTILTTTDLHLIEKKTVEQSEMITL